ncbi:TrmB family transcriptional regulator [Candidatus Micrarchaeota archaeon]|nr:TrmB family transcriptional regulator [Candidatus Micrarchaeota archaeon]
MSIDSGIIDTLRHFGLNQYEARAYAALCNFGSQTVGELSDKSKVPRPRSYDILASLQEKGFVTVQNGRPVSYSAVPLGEAVKTLKKQREGSLAEEMTKIESLSQMLNEKLKQSDSPVSSDERVWTLKGRDAIYSRMNSMISSSKKHLILATAAEGLKRKMKVHGKDLEKAMDRGVKVHIIAPQGEGDASQVATSVSKKEVPTRMLLNDDEALLFLTDPSTKAEDEWGLWLKSPHVVKTLKNSLGMKV